MQTLVTEPPYGKTPTDSLRKKWTRDDCIRLDAAGAFGKLELIDGELIDRMGTRPPHQITQGLMIEWLMRRFGYRRVRSEIAIDG